MKYYLKMVIAAICILLLMVCIHFQLTMELDRAVYQTLREHMKSEVVVQYLHIISNVFSPVNCLIYILIILVGLFVYRRFLFWWYGLWCFSIFAIGTFLKYVIQRTRPNIDIDGFSFPSMHVLCICILVSFILLLKRNKLLKIIAVCLVVSLMISRIYLQAHYFTDTLASLFVIYMMLQACYLMQNSDKRFQTTAPPDKN